MEIPLVLIAQSPYGGYTGVHIAQSPPFPLLRRSADYTDEGGWMRVKLAGAGRQLRNREETRRFVGFVGLNPHRYERVME